MKVVEESGSEIAILTCSGCGHVWASDDPQSLPTVPPRLKDGIAQEAEITDDCAGAIAALEEQKGAREDAVVLLTDHYFNDTDIHGPGELCGPCQRGIDGLCGPDTDEPCPAFVKAEARFKKFASVRVILDERKT